MQSNCLGLFLLLVCACLDVELQLAKTGFSPCPENEKEVADIGVDCALQSSSRH
jgi:hypothetical protein